MLSDFQNQTHQNKEVNKMNNKERLIKIKDLKNRINLLNNHEDMLLRSLTMNRKQTRAYQKKLVSVATYKGGGE